MKDNLIVGSYVATPTDKRLIPGAAVRKPVEYLRLPLIFVPGIAGSRLGSAPDASDVWITPCNPIEAMDLNGSGAELYATAVLRDTYFPLPSDYIDYVDRAFGPVPAFRGGTPRSSLLPGDAAKQVGDRVYGKLIDFLVETAGYVLYDDERNLRRRSLSQDGGDPDYSQQPLGPNLFVFPYDWRKDAAESAGELAKFVKLALSFNPDVEQVDILAHSMGGLVSRRFIIDQQDNKVRKFITIDSPFLGAPKLLNVLQTGDFVPIPWSDNRVMKRVSRFFQGGHQLGPSHHYFEIAKEAKEPMYAAQPMSEYGWDADKSGQYYDGEFDYARFKMAFDTVLFADSTPVSVNEKFHDYKSSSGNSQTDWRTDNTGVESFHLIGVQHAIKTIGSVRHIARLGHLKSCGNLSVDVTDLKPPTNSVLVHPPNDYTQTESLRVVHHEVELGYVRGDGTVPELSQTRKAGLLDFNDPNARSFVFYGTNTSSDVDVDHNGMHRSARTHHAIDDLLNNIEPVADTPPNWDVVTTFSVRISDLDANTLFWKPSPDVIDAATSSGFFGTCFERLLNYNFGKLVPNGERSFEFLAESDRVPYVEFDAPDRPFNVVVLKRTNGVIQERYVFRDVVSAANAHVAVVTGPSEGPELSIYSQIAGTTDVIPPTARLSGVDAEKLMSPTIQSNVDGTFLSFEGKDHRGRPARIYIVHDNNGDGDLDDEMYHWLPDGRVTRSEITDDNYYIRAEDDALNLSPPLQVTGGNEHSICPPFTYDPLGNGLATRTKELEANFLDRQQSLAQFQSIITGGIPILEGYELAVFDELMALNSGMMLRILDMTDHNQANPARKRVFYRILRRQLVQVSQAASRAAFGYIVGKANTNLGQILSLDQQQFAERDSFENYITNRAVISGVFSSAELELIGKAARAASCEPNTLASLLADDCAANSFLAESLRFIRHVQDVLKVDYDRRMAALADSTETEDQQEYVNRSANLHRVEGTTGVRSYSLSSFRDDARIDLVSRVFNRGPNPVTDVKFELIVNGVVLPDLPPTPIAQLGPDVVHYMEGNYVMFQPYYVFIHIDQASQSAGTEPTIRTAYLIVDPDGSIKETDKEDNWYGFQYYVLNLNNPCPPTFPSLPAIRPPPTNLLKRDSVCD